MKPETIKTGIIKNWIAGIKSNALKPKTVNNLWKQFRAILNWFAQQNDEPKRAWYPTPPVIPEDEQRWFTPDEARRIIDAAQGQYQGSVSLAAHSGLRFGELSGLHVRDVDFARGLIRVRRSVWRQAPRLGEACATFGLTQQQFRFSGSILAAELRPASSKRKRVRR